MAWIESHQNLERHPKRVELSVRLGWNKAETIGRLHMLWWWTLDFAEDGDLRKYNDAQIAEAMCVDIANSSDLVKALVGARWLEREPYFRVRNWWCYIGRFLKVKYKDNPAKWQRIQVMYAYTSADSVTDTVTGTVTDTVTRPTLTNLNQTLPPTKLPAAKSTKPNKLSMTERELAMRLEVVLGLQWINDAGKWINRIKKEPRKSERVIAEVESALKESKVRSTPAQYAEQVWKEFK